MRVPHFSKIKQNIKKKTEEKLSHCMLCSIVHCINSKTKNVILLLASWLFIPCKYTYSTLCISIQMTAIMYSSCFSVRYKWIICIIFISLWNAHKVRCVYTTYYTLNIIIITDIKFTHVLKRSSNHIGLCIPYEFSIDFCA